MLQLLQPTADSPILQPLEFGPPILNAFAKVAMILGRAISPPSQPLAPIEIAPISTAAALPTAASAPSIPPAVVTDTPAVAPLRVPVCTPVTPNKQTILKANTNLLAASVPTVHSFTKSHKEQPVPGSTIRLRASARLKNMYNRLNHQPSPHLAQSVQHDPTIAGKMFNPATGHAETIDSLLRGPDALIWTTSLANEWGRCMHGLSKNRTAQTTNNNQRE